MKEFTIFLIHNTHTDVGFTGTQEEIEYQHYDYLLQVISALESGKYSGFRWQCENTWQIDNFYEHASLSEKQLLEKWVRAGKIGLSGNYLNMTEIADSPTLEYWVKHSRDYASSIGANSYSAMSCDVNGYGWAFPDILSNNGYRYFLGSIHTHHGMYPMFRCPVYFRWQGPNGGMILTYISEHYNLGNELGFCQHSMLSYSVHDRFSRRLETTMLCTDAKTTEKEELEVAKYRIQQYIKGLVDSGYELDFAPVLVSGAYTDNAAPNPDICERVDKLNQLLVGKVHIKLSLLDDFFAELEKTGVQIPVVKGDFPDWWASGIGSLPNSVRIYRKAQRNMRLVRKLTCDNKDIDVELNGQAMKNAILFAEHTWSYCATVFYPWSIQNKLVEQKNAAYAACFHSASMKLLLNAKRNLGDKQLRPGRPYSWTVINPNSFDMSYPIRVPIEAWEYVDGCKFDFSKYELREETTGQLLSSQITQTTRGPAFDTVISLGAKSRKTITMTEKHVTDSSAKHGSMVSTDSVRDLYRDEGAIGLSNITTQHFDISIRRDGGLASIIDRATGIELLNGDSIGAFAGIRDVTHISDDTGMARKLVRRSMGRNLVAFSTERYMAKLVNAVVVENGSVYTTVELTYRLEGVERYVVRIKIYKQSPLLTADIVVGMRGGLEPENLYIALPFAAKGDTYIGKAGCIMRPGVDQIPGTCQSIYAVQDGIIRQNGTKDVLVTMDDLPLVVFGLPQPEKVKLYGDDDSSINSRSMYAVAVNNYWETNFPCNTAGDYQFTVNIMLAEHDCPAGQAERIKAFCEGVTALRH